MLTITANRDLYSTEIQLETDIPTESLSDISNNYGASSIVGATEGSISGKIPVHRENDSRICGAITVGSMIQSTVYANSKLIAVNGDQNIKHGEFSDISALTAKSNNVYIEGSLVVNVGDEAAADSLCDNNPHCNPKASSGSSNVFVADPIGSSGSFELAPNTFYEPIVKQNGATIPVDNDSFELSGSDGRIILNETSSNGNPVVQTNGGKYNATVVNNSGNYSNTTINLVETNPPVPDVLYGDGTKLSVGFGGGNTYGNLSPSNPSNWIRLDLKGGISYYASVSGFGDNPVKGLYFNGLYDFNGNALPFNDTYGTLERLLEDDFKGYLSVASSGGSVGDFKLTIGIREPIVSDDYTADINTTGYVGINSSSSGTLEKSDDIDWFKTPTLEKDKIYRIQIKGSSDGGGSLEYPYLKGIFDQNGSYIKNTQDSPVGKSRTYCEFFYTSTFSSPHFIGVGNSYDDTGSYTVLLSLLDDDFASNKNTVGILNVNSSATGNIEISGDKDWFKMPSLISGKTYIIEANGSDTNDGTLSDPMIYYVYDYNGFIIQGTQDNNSGTGNNAKLIFTATDPLTRDYYVSISGYYSATGTYTVTLTEQ